MTNDNINQPEQSSGVLNPSWNKKEREREDFVDYISRRELNNGNPCRNFSSSLRSKLSNNALFFGILMGNGSDHSL